MSAPFAKPIGAQTRYCAVYGHPVRHSASPPMQNAGLAALGLDWRYLAFDVPPEELAAAIAGAKAMRFVGLNLTVPHKLLAVELVDDLDESARTWGAVNTIRFEARQPDGSWVSTGSGHVVPAGPVRSRGYNTDAEAMLHALREELQFAPPGQLVFVLGAGGAGRVAALRLAAAGVGALHLVNRTAAKAEAMIREIRARFPAVTVALGYPLETVDLVVNATSLGLRPEDPLPFDEAGWSLRQAAAVYDMIYRPAETRLLQLAAHAGCRTANGLGMLLHQGARALEIWSERPAPVVPMREALVRTLYV